MSQQFSQPKENTMLIRQGDVLLRRIAKLPETAKPVDGPVIVEYGEVTGHTHRFTRGATMFRDDGSGSGGQYIAIMGDEHGVMTHEEHGAAEFPNRPGFDVTQPLFPPGSVSERLPQNEYSPAAIIRVAD